MPIPNPAKLFSRSGFRTGWLRLLVILGVLLLGILVFLGTANRPWTDGMAVMQAEGKKVKIEHYATTGLWWAAVFNLVVVVILMSLSRWIARPLGSEFQRINEKKKVVVPGKVIVCSVILSAILTSLWTLPRLNHSLWFDEEYTMRRVVVADHKRKHENRTTLIGEVSRRPVTWTETLWFFEMPNNHPLFSICARLSHGLSGAGLESGDPEALYFSARALRIPAWLAGIGALETVALMLSSLGLHRAAVAAPLLLSIHPWFLRYASEARGYAFLFLLGPLLIFLLQRAVTRGTWLWWITFGLAQFLYLYSNASGVYLLLLLNLVGITLCFLRQETSKSDRWTLVGRLLLVNAFGAMAFIQMMAPNLLQFSERYQPNPEIHLLINGDMIRDMLANYATGMTWHVHKWDANSPYSETISGLLANHPITTKVLLGSLVALIALGVAALAKQGTYARLLIPVLLLAAPLFVFGAYRKGVFIFYWYAVFILPFLWALVAAGLEFLSGLGGRSEMRRHVVMAVVTLALLIFFGWTTARQRELLVSVPLEPTRESVATYREVLNPFAPGFDDVISIGMWKYTRAYDPGHYWTRSFEDFETVIALAEKEGKPLYVNYSMPEDARKKYPQMMALLDNPEIFKPAEVLWGLQPATARFVQEYIPGSHKAGSSAPE